MSPPGPGPGTGEGSEPSEPSELAEPSRGRWRSRLARPVLAGADPWRDRVAAHLAEHGAEGPARAFRGCGRTAIARDCDVPGGCGASAGAVEVLVSCHLRGCGWCERQAAARASERVAGAFSRLPGYLAAARRGKLAELAELAKGAELARDEWTRRARRRMDDARSRRSPELARRDMDAAARMLARARRAEKRRRLAELARHDAGRERWTPRMITLSPRWNPSAASALEPEGLRARVAEVFARWDRCWAGGLGVQGLAGAVARVELSSGGHVHLHVLYFGPWRDKRTLAKLAGCFVKVRELRCRGSQRPEDALRDAAKECAKYTAKGLGPLSSEWIAGGSRRVIHPELAAHWIVGTRGVKLGRVYGLARDAWRAELAAEPSKPSEPPSPPACACCGADLSEAPRRLAKVAELARGLGREGWTLRARRVPGGELPARVRAVEVQGPAPPRVSGAPP